MDTPPSLFDRIRLHPEIAWKEFLDLYQPFIQRWLRCDPALREEVDDLFQEVMKVLVVELPRFSHNGTGAFRAWLRLVVLNRVKAHGRGRQRQPVALDSVLTQLEDPASELSRQWDQEHNLHVMQRLLELAEAKFVPKTMEAFRRVFFKEEKPEAVAAELGMSVAAVYLAKSHVLSYLRQEGRGFLD